MNQADKDRLIVAIHDGLDAVIGDRVRWKPKGDPTPPWERKTFSKSSFQKAREKKYRKGESRLQRTFQKMHSPRQARKAEIAAVRKRGREAGEIERGTRPGALHPYKAKYHTRRLPAQKKTAIYER